MLDLPNSLNIESCLVRMFFPLNLVRSPFHECQLIFELLRFKLMLSPFPARARLHERTRHVVSVDPLPNVMGRKSKKAKLKRAGELIIFLSGSVANLTLLLHSSPISSPEQKSQGQKSETQCQDQEKRICSKVHCG